MALSKDERKNSEKVQLSLIFQEHFIDAIFQALTDNHPKPITFADVLTIESTCTSIYKQFAETQYKPTKKNFLLKNSNYLLHGVEHANAENFFKFRGIIETNYSADFAKNLLALIGTEDLLLSKHMDAIHSEELIKHINGMHLLLQLPEEIRDKFPLAKKAYEFLVDVLKQYKSDSSIKLSPNELPLPLPNVKRHCSLTNLNEFTIHQDFEFLSEDQKNELQQLALLLKNAKEFDQDKLLEFVVVYDKYQRHLNHIACSSGNVKTLEFLADVMSMDEQDAFGLQPFHYACASGTRETVHYFLDIIKPEQKQIRIQHRGVTALCGGLELAVITGQRHTVDLLLTKLPKNTEFGNLLHLSILSKQVEMTKHLCSFDEYCKTWILEENEGINPYMLAVLLGFDEGIIEIGEAAQQLKIDDQIKIHNVFAPDVRVENKSDNPESIESVEPKSEKKPAVTNNNSVYSHPLFDFSPKQEVPKQANKPTEAKKPNSSENNIFSEFEKLLNQYNTKVPKQQEKQPAPNKPGFFSPFGEAFPQFPSFNTPFDDFSKSFNKDDKVPDFMNMFGLPKK